MLEGVVQSVEMLLSADLDAAVRSEWALLAAAGVPSQADHTGASNAPHVTVAVADHVDAATDDRLRALRLGRPEVVLGGMLVFPGRRSVLARLVVPSAALLEVHAAVADALGDVEQLSEHLAPGRWTPHVTIARRLRDEELDTAWRLLVDRPRELVGTGAGLRRWDAGARETWDLPGT